MDGGSLRSASSAPRPQGQEQGTRWKQEPVSFSKGSLPGHLRCPICASGTRSRMMRQASYTIVEGSNCIVFTTLPMLILSDKATMMAPEMFPLLLHLLRKDGVSGEPSPGGKEKPSRHSLCVPTPLPPSLAQKLEGGRGHDENRRLPPHDKKLPFSCIALEKCGAPMARQALLAPG